MNSRIYLLAAACIFTGIYSSYAQDETDAFRASDLKTQATARSIAIGGAVGALGADFSSLTVNPAGIGVYRRSEFTFTPSIKLNKTNSSYTGVASDDNATRFSIGNLGVVFTGAQGGRRYERSKWKSVSFGIGINRIADFNRNYNYKGQSDLDNGGTSGAEVFSIDANKYINPLQQMPEGSLADMGYQSYLLDTNASGYYVPVTFNAHKLNQQRTVVEKGGITDINISLGGNYEEKLMLGVTLGIPSIRFKREITYKESDAQNIPNNFFDYFQYTESLLTRGSGINLKIGAIYKPVESFRVGVALHSPTLFNLKDEYSSTLTTNTENFKTVLGAANPDPKTDIKSPAGLYEYSLLTPWRAVLSAAGIFGKYGFITADYEYVDYASARFDFGIADRDRQTFINNYIKSTYKGTSILRVGLEGRIQQFALRLGVGYHANPYKTAGYNGQRVDVSGGIGFRQDNWFLDLGIAQSRSETQEQPYYLNYLTPVHVPTAVIKNTFTNVALTFGVKF